MPLSFIFHRSSFRLSAAVALLAIAAVACVRPPVPSGYFKEYAGLAPQPPPHVSVFAERTAAGRRPRPDHVLLVLPARWETARLRKPAHERDLLALLDFRLHLYLLRMAPSSIIVTQHRDTDDYLRMGVNVTELHVAITDLERGVGLVRMLIGFYLGATHLQIEGRLIDHKTGDERVRFARRGRHDGVVWGLPTPWALSPRYCWRLSIDQSARLLAGYIASQLTPPPPRWWDSAAAGQPIAPALAPATRR